MKNICSILLKTCIGGTFLIGSVGCSNKVEWQLSPTKSDLFFDKLAATWDEGIPLGNATVGSLVWERDSVLRMSLDRTDLWDLRPADSLSGENYRFSWVKKHIADGNYLPVQKKFDWPYDRSAAPSKIPGAALEFTRMGAVEHVHLYLKNAVCETAWKNGAKLYTFVHATEPVGWFVLENIPDSVVPAIVPPVYEKEKTETVDPVTGQDLALLGYKQGVLTEKEGMITYHQKGWKDFSYDVAVKWKNEHGKCIGAWSVTSSLSGDEASAEVEQAFQRGLEKDYETHLSFWTDFWNQSSVTLPDSVLQKQYNNEMYKLGSVARENSYPISLQAVWTADNGKLPPWKGDYHHDLNTQLSYWPTYTGNHLKEESGYLNTLWNQRDVYRSFTRQYFEKEGLNVPGVCTLTGEPMGGWIQYAMSQTTAAWLSQHFYLHWKYTADDLFLKEKGYPFVKEVALFLENQTELNAEGKRVLPYSSSPEIFDNSLNAWFKTMTNYDLSLVSNLFKMASEMALALNLKTEAEHWDELRNQLPDFDLDETGALTFAKGFPYAESHRHFSHAMAIHPLGLIDYSQGAASRKIIDATLKKMEACGPDWWCGYSYSWFGNMKARAFDGEGAYRALRTFADCFCLKNTFHANGDQSGTGKSKFTYRPFTLEGNFAFAAGIQEMLLQSHTDTIRIFPAVPEAWKNIKFDHLRARGAFLLSAEKKDGKIVSVKILSEKGKKLLMVSPFTGEVINRSTKPGELIVLEK